ncbi:MAG TPA: EamA family transporter [Kofleriaceae bacterium]|nr:EamA family transporter [Kofleriaceae bacterium]
MLAYLVCAFVWGTTWRGIRVCIGEGGYPTISAAALRFLLAAILLAPLALRQPKTKWPKPAQWPWLVAAGVLDAVGYALVYLGEERVPGGLAAVLFGTQPLILAMLLTATRMEVVRWGELVGALVSIVGVGVIFADRLDVSSQQAIGVALILGSVVASTTYTMMMKRHGDGVHAFVSTWIFIAVTAICLCAVAATRGFPIPWPPPLEPTLALIYLAVFGSVVAFATYFWLLSQVSLMTMSTLSFVLPIIALVVDALFETEVRLNARAYAGIGVTLSGLAVSLLWKSVATRMRMSAVQV